MSIKAPTKNTTIKVTIRNGQTFTVTVANVEIFNGDASTSVVLTGPVDIAFTASSGKTVMCSTTVLFIPVDDTMLETNTDIILWDEVA